MTRWGGCVGSGRGLRPRAGTATESPRRTGHPRIHHASTTVLPSSRILKSPTHADPNERQVRPGLSAALTGPSRRFGAKRKSSTECPPRETRRGGKFPFHDLHTCLSEVSLVNLVNLHEPGCNRTGFNLREFPEGLPTVPSGEAYARGTRICGSAALRAESVPNWTEGLWNYFTQAEMQVPQ